MLRLGKKDRTKGIDKKHVEAMLKEELGAYVRREDLREAFDKIAEDKKKASLWDTLPFRKKIKVLRYIIGQRRGEHGKK